MTGAFNVRTFVASVAANCILLVSRQEFESGEAARNDKERTNCFLNKNTVLQFAETEETPAGTQRYSTERHRYTGTQWHSTQILSLLANIRILILQLAVGTGCEWEMKLVLFI